MTIAGIVLSFLRFYLGIKPEQLDANVFAFYSQYFSSKSFSMIGNNLMEEAGGLLLLVGLFFISFSRLKRESEIAIKIRFRSMILAIYIQSAILALSFIFVYGIGFVSLAILNIYLFFILYNILFLIQYLCFIRSMKHDELD